MKFALSILALSIASWNPAIKLDAVHHHAGYGILIANTYWDDPDGPNPHGPDPHGRDRNHEDIHDEQHDPDLPADREEHRYHDQRYPQGGEKPQN